MNGWMEVTSMNATEFFFPLLDTSYVLPTPTTTFKVCFWKIELLEMRFAID